MHFADLTDRTSIDYLVRELRDAPDRPYVFHLGAQAHVGESWHRPYETVMTNTVGTLNLLQSIVDWGLELEKFDTAGTSEEYGNVRDDVADHHTFDDAGALILHERSPINPKSIYATAKVAAVSNFSSSSPWSTIDWSRFSVPTVFAITVSYGRCHDSPTCACAPRWKTYGRSGASRSSRTR